MFFMKYIQGKALLEFLPCFVMVFVLLPNKSSRQNKGNSYFSTSGFSQGLLILSTFGTIILKSVFPGVHRGIVNFRTAYLILPSRRSSVRLMRCH